jgi:hypothetical protein
MDRFLVKTNNKTAYFEEDSTQEAVSETFVARENHAPLVEAKNLLRQEKHAVIIPNILNSGSLQTEVYPLLPLCVICCETIQPLYETVSVETTL